MTRYREQRMHINSVGTSTARHNAAREALPGGNASLANSIMHVCT